MEMTSLFGTFSRDEMREREGTSRKKAKEEEEKRKREAAKPGSHARELNPYYKDGGTGLPQEQQKAVPAPAAAASQITGLDAGWLRKALQRAKEQASSEGRSLEEIAAQRWGGWFSQKFLRPSEEPSKSSALSQRFQKPGNDDFSR
ncbi:CWF19-like protein 2 [Portunus trituberculatus]|uniref:CWF19-like protein 2 n=1 Tax=Portunus trituberculatus TaxID=210409 RepID=A0A5B7E3N6_PORTR|nr:CWF19-like protein 2 [Portunus trituberculatus]